MLKLHVDSSIYWQERSLYLSEFIKVPGLYAGTEQGNGKRQCNRGISHVTTNYTNCAATIFTVTVWSEQPP